MKPEIQTFHKYNTLVRRKLVKPLMCPDCQEPYTLRCTEDGDPVLQCFYCYSLVQPGLRLYNDVRAIVREHFE